MLAIYFANIRVYTSPKVIKASVHKIHFKVCTNGKVREGNYPSKKGFPRFYLVKFRDKIKYLFIQIYHPKKKSQPSVKTRSIKATNPRGFQFSCTYNKHISSLYENLSKIYNLYEVYVNKEDVDLKKFEKMTKNRGSGHC